MKFRIEAMTCGGCARGVTRAIQKVDPGARVEVDLDAKVVEVRTDRPAADFAGPLESAGFPAVPA